MKKIATTLLVLVAMLSLTVGSALALDGLITLVETRNDWGGGVIFVLEFSGNFPDNYFTGYVTEGDNRYPIHCNVVSENVVQCTVSRAVAGKNVVLHLGEFIFWTFVPEAVPPKETASAAPSQYCYNVYDTYFYEDSELGYYILWEAFAVHCQDAPANFGDVLQDFPNPDYNGVFDYEFLPESPSFVCADNSITENAYFWFEECG